MECLFFISDIHPSSGNRYEIGKVKEYIREIIQYDELAGKKYDMKAIDEYIDIMAETICSNERYLRIGEDNVPINLIRGIFMKYKMAHIIYVYERMNASTGTIWNRRAYLLKVLYRAPSTMDLWYKTHAPRANNREAAT